MVSRNLERANENDGFKMTALEYTLYCYQTIIFHRTGRVYTIRIRPQTETLYLVGSDISFLCELPSDSQYRMPMWIAPDLDHIPKRFNAPSNHIYVEAESTYATRLYINRLVKSDSGDYRCVSGPLSGTFSVTVTGNKSLSFTLFFVTEDRDICFYLLFVYPIVRVFLNSKFFPINFF